VPYTVGIDNKNASPYWSSLSQAKVLIGGVSVTYQEAETARDILRNSRTSAIAPVLSAAQHPLASCDYFGAAEPYLAKARQEQKTGRSGAAGRHVTKNAFLDAIEQALSVAEREEVEVALRAFSEDERYAAAMAREAVAIRERAHAAAKRSQVKAAMDGAVAQCRENGPVQCTLASACGTGACPFAPAVLAGISVAADGSGRNVRPPAHVLAGSVFSGGEVVAALLVADPYRVSVHVRDEDFGHGEDAVVAA
jgi:hypothetical protein